MNSAEKTILIVEDNEDDVFALTWAFRKAQVPNPVQVVTDGQQAVDYLAGSGQFSTREAYPLPTLVFLDLKLPYMNGFEVLTWIRRQPNLSSLPVIILTGSDEGRDHERADGLGVEFYLVKPATPQDLIDVMKSVQGSLMSAVGGHGTVS